MTCPRCAADEPLASSGRGWCAACERSYDGWSRRFAGDVVWELLAGTVIVAVISVGIPILGVSSLVGALGIFAGAGTAFALHRLNRARRRRQFLDGGAMPRAYLPPPP